MHTETCNSLCDKYFDPKDYVSGIERGASGGHAPQDAGLGRINTFYLAVYKRVFIQSCRPKMPNKMSIFWTKGVILLQRRTPVDFRWLGVSFPDSRVGTPAC